MGFVVIFRFLFIFLFLLLFESTGKKWEWSSRSMHRDAKLPFPFLPALPAAKQGLIQPSSPGSRSSLTLTCQVLPGLSSSIFARFAAPHSYREGGLSLCCLSPGEVPCTSGQTPRRRWVARTTPALSLFLPTTDNVPGGAKGCVHVCWGGVSSLDKREDNFCQSLLE